MKKHAIIPVFIPHQGCPNDCVFCNQKAITARQPDVTMDEVRNTIETWLSTLEGREGMETIEIAFFGGSFTGIPLEQQSAYLEIAREYKECGRIHKIHLSTRPDYISEEILDNLKLDIFQILWLWEVVNPLIITKILSSLFGYFQMTRA
jgi:histone acetyltransferase (RNA polymerase elongator complex component)